MKEYVKIINIIDKSGSMSSMIDMAINGFNEFLTEQKSVDGKALVSTILFSDIYKPLYEDQDIQKCKLLNKKNYTPGGTTKLYDAIGKTINYEINKLGNLPKSERPNKTLCVILTDGYENASREFNKDQVKKLIGEMKEDFNWEFIFLAANEDATLTAETMGISRGNSFSFANTSAGLSDAYTNVSRATKVYRMSAEVSMDNLLNDEKPKSSKKPKRHKTSKK